MIKIESGCGIPEQVIITVFITATQVDNIVVVGVWHDTVRVGVIFQLLVPALRIVDKPQYLATIALDFVMINTRDLRKL